ncbi:MAG: aspartate carbamoyltransferase, partial [Armatimonadetes bacterium]|nr:aspartate carbamoyltransferase [Armatimonadota bacterium]
LFYEPSTRTRLSFEAAMLRLGGQVVGFADPRASSAAKGETLADTARIVGGYCDIIVIRHPLMGAAKVAADYAGVPVINAGDGPHEHPTQTLTDLFAIRRAFGCLNGLRVGLCGDLKYGRTVHSLAPVLARLGSHMVCIAPDELQMPEEVLAEVETISGRRPEMTADLSAAAADLDVLYMTRIQRERFPDPADYERVRGVYVLTPQVLARAPERMIVLHPLPRVDEIDPAVDADPRAWYFRQAHGGVPVRMALISLLLGLEPSETQRRRYGLDAAPATESLTAAPAGVDLPQPEIIRDAPPCRQAGCITAEEPLPAEALRLPGGYLVCAYCERRLPD